MSNNNNSKSNNGYIGYCFIKRKEGSGVLLEIWQEVVNNNDDKSPLQWKKISEFKQYK